MPDKPIYKFLPFVAFLVSQLESCPQGTRLEIIKLLTYVSSNKDGKIVILQNDVFKVLFPLQNEANEELQTWV